MKSWYQTHVLSLLAYYKFDEVDAAIVHEQEECSK